MGGCDGELTVRHYFLPLLGRDQLTALPTPPFHRTVSRHHDLSIQQAFLSTRHTAGDKRVEVPFFTGLLVSGMGG